MTSDLRVAPVVAAVGVFVLLGLGGCKQYDPEWVQQRQDNLDAAIEEFNAHDFGRVLCEGQGGKPLPNQGFTHYFLFEGNEVQKEIVAGLEGLGYSGGTPESSFTLAREDGISAHGYRIGQGVESDNIEKLLAADGCDTMPEGSLFVQFREIPAGDSSSFPELTPHDLRHTAASIAISAGANPKAVQRMLGHASAAMTLDTYADLFEDDLDAVSDRMNQARAEAFVGFL